MFDNLGKTAPSKMAAGKKSRAKAVLAAQKLHTAAGNIRLLCQKIRAVAEDHADLRNIRAVIAAEGLSRTLVSLCPVLQYMSTAIPAVESMDAIPLAPQDPRVKQALEDLDTVSEGETTAVVSWMDNVATNLDDVFHGMNDQLEDLVGTVGGLITEMTGQTAPDDDLKAATVTAISADAALARLDILLQVIPKLDIPNVYDDGKKEELLAAFSEIVSLLGPIAGTYNQEFYLHVDTDKIEAQYLPADGTLYDLGYTVEKTIEILGKASELIGALQALSDLHPQFMERLRSQGEAVQSDAGTDTADTDGGETGGTPEQTTAPETTAEPAPELDTSNLYPSDDQGTSSTTTPANEDADGGAESGEGGSSETTTEPSTPEAVDMLRTVVSSYVSIMLVAIESSVGALNRLVAVADEVEDLLEEDEDEPETGGGSDDTAQVPDEQKTDQGQNGEGGEGGSDDGQAAEEAYNPLAGWDIK